MKRCNFFVKLFMIVVFLLLIYNVSFSDRTVTIITWENQEAEVISGEFVIQLKEGINYSDINNLLSQNNCWTKDTCNILRLALIGFSPKRDEGILEKIDIFKNSPLLRFTEPNFVMYPASGEENEEYFDSLWGFHNWGQPIKGNAGTEDVDVDLLEAWLIETGNPSCIISILDVGVAMDSVADTLCHPDLLDSTRIILDRAFRDGDVRDVNGHGTKVLGVAAAAKNNSGVIGACYNCNFLVTKVDNTPSSQYSWAKAIAHVSDIGADIISLSWFSWQYTAMVETSVAYALQKGVVITGCAGNIGGVGVCSPGGFASYGRFIQGHNCCDPDTCPNYPENCGYRNVISVGAINILNELYGAYSNDSLKLTVTAPGCDIFACTPPYILSSGYEFVTGTSFSTPLFAGICGLILSQEPGLSPDSVRTIIENTAVDIGEVGWDSYFGYGRVNAFDALKSLFPSPNHVGLVLKDTSWSDSMHVLGDV